MCFTGSPNPPCSGQRDPWLLLPQDTPVFVRDVSAREHHGVKTAPTVESAIHELMDLAWNLVYDLPAVWSLLGDGLFVEDFIGIHFWLDGFTRYTAVQSRDVAVPFVDIRPVDAIPFHHRLLGADDPKTFFTLPVLTAGYAAVARVRGALPHGTRSTQVEACFVTIPMRWPSG